MERYTNWRDKGTGISPFMPVTIPSSKSKVTTSLATIAKSVIFILKLPIVILVLSIYYITSLNAILKFLVLILCGFQNLDILVDGVKKSNQSKIKLLLPKVGDLVVINYSSPIDGLFAAMITKSNWSRINILIPDNGKLYKYSIWSLFAFTFTGNHTGQVVELEKLTKSVNFLLLEGTPSNNSAILPFVPVNVSTGFNVKSVVVKYAPSYFSLPVPHVSKFRYIFELLTVLKIEKNFIKLKVYDFGTNFNVVELKKSFELNSLNVVESRLNLAEKGKFWESFNKKAR